MNLGGVVSWTPAYPYVGRVGFVGLVKKYRNWPGRFLVLKTNSGDVKVIAHESHKFETGQTVSFEAVTSGDWLIVGPEQRVEIAGRARLDLEEQTFEVLYVGQVRSRNNGELSAKLMVRQGDSTVWATSPSQVIAEYVSRVSGTHWRFGAEYDPGGQVGAGLYGVLGVSEDANLGTIKGRGTVRCG